MITCRHWCRTGNVWTYRVTTGYWDEHAFAYIKPDVHVTEMYYGEVFHSASPEDWIIFRDFTDLEELKHVIETTVELMG